MVLHAYPNEVTATKSGDFIAGGSFFLDFSRPLRNIRSLGGFGPVASTIVPVVHEGEDSGGYVISVMRSSPYFSHIRDLWKQRHPSTWSRKSGPAGGLEIVAHFATQFPEDAGGR